MNPPLKEGQQIELKRAWVDRALEDLAAFSNSDGGRLYIGVDDSGQVVGFEGDDKDIQRIANLIHTRLGLTPRICIQQIENMPVLVLEVESSSGIIPYNGRYLRRVGSTNRDFAPHELANHILRRGGQLWENLPSALSWDCYDWDTIKTFVRMAKPRLPKVDDSEPERLLNNLGLIREGKLTNAGVLLFSPQPQTHFLQAVIRVGVFRSPTDIVDSHDIGGNLFQQLDLVMEQLRRLLKVRYDTSVDELSLEGIQRREIWEYPLEALREAIINAIVHRDYTSTGHVQVRLYDDHVEIWNSGTLPEELSPEALRGPHGSFPRNPALARVFYYCGLIEQWGSGTLKILKLCKEQDLPEPLFEEVGACFRVTFLRDPFTNEYLESLGLNDRQIKAVMHARERGSIKNKEYQELMRVSKRTASSELSELVQKGVMVRTGGQRGRGSTYRLTIGQIGQ